MEIKGKVIQHLDPVTGQGKKGEWKKQEFVIETLDQYPKKVCFTIWNDKADLPDLGSSTNVFFNAESQEYNGRWFTNLIVWKVQAEEENKPEPASNINSDGLPF